MQTIDCEPHRMSEPVPVLDIFVSGLGEVEDLGGGVFRFTFFAKHHGPSGEEQIVVAKLVAPCEAVPPALIMAAKAVGYRLATAWYSPGKELN